MTTEPTAKDRLSYTKQDYQSIDMTVCKNNLHASTENCQLQDTRNDG